MCSPSTEAHGSGECFDYGTLKWFRDGETVEKKKNEPDAVSY